jgi:hypothetical protein
MIEGAQPAEPPAGATEQPARPQKELPAELEAELQRRGIHHRDWIGGSHHAHALRDEFKPSQLNPAFHGNPDFDWETVFASLDGEDHSNSNTMADDSTRCGAYAMSARLLARLLDWLIDANLKDSRGEVVLRSIGVRTVAMAWVINPQRFDNASLAVIAKSLGFKGANSISPLSAEFSRRFGIQNHFQDHDWRKK